MLTKGVDKFSKSFGGIRERSKAAAAAAPFPDKAPIYWPGERFKAFHGQRGEDDADAQMMDMYYGAKLDACTKELLHAIYAWQAANKGSVVSKRATVVGKLREQVSDFQAQWEPFAAMN